ncbi:outer membrane protein insertion porin family [Haloferula luteola]|uniref:Outer membrane protein assembly factor BamA n=1 Tax=Haloferula luteola TaxID=595692 RepID=A0A840VDX6_9BACT|nr:outer membrane protein assembly factor BamA [Haloferula luteola]MBB5351041.1 outer membrane protein insertion porin family [Haloferula luteola]
MDFSSFQQNRDKVRATGRVLGLAAAVCFSTLAPVSAQDFEGQKVTGVDFRYEGPRTVDEERLRNFIQLAPGTDYSTDTIDSDIKALYESGFVNDVRVLAEPVGGGVRVVYSVSPREGVAAIGFVGNSVFSDTKLAKASKMTAGGALSDQAILDARRNLEQYYMDAGYPDVTISHRIQASASGNGAELIFVIDEGAKNEIRDIRFEGNGTFDDRTLRRQMNVKEKGLFSFFTKSGRFEVDQLDDDLELVLDYYRSKGYLRAQSPGIRREPVGDGRVDLVIPIQEGEKYTVKGVGFGKMTVFTEEELYPVLSLNGGDAYNSKKMRADMTTIRSYYGSRGYADATVTPDIRDAGPNQVNVIYRVTEGRRFRVGNVNIQGNTKTQDRVIRREVPLKPDDYFNSVELDTTKSRLEGLQYFSNVQVDSSPSARGGGYRDVDILVDEGKTGSVSAGIGFSSIDNVVGFVTLEQSNFDIRNPWRFTGGGQRFAMNMRIGSERSDFSISLVEPWFMGRELALGGELFYRDSQYFSDFYEQTNVGAAVNIRKPLTEHTYFTAEYRLEQVEIDLESTVPATSLLVPEAGDYIRSAVSAHWVYDSRDALIETRAGSKVDVGLDYAGSFLGGDVDIVGLSVRGQKFWNLKWDSILSVNGELAAVDATSGSVPIFDRMFLGGARTLRGYDFRDVGPRDPATNEVVGGTSLGYGQLEYSVPIIDNVRVAAFYDVGFVNSASNLYHDVGFGVRLRLPVSPVPIALDYAVPIESPDARADQGGRFNFSLSYEY